MNELWSHLGAT